jgi:hypothetical protein
MSAIGRRLYEVHFGKANLASEADVRTLLSEAAQAANSASPHKFSAHFLWTEWATVVDAWQLDSWESSNRHVLRSM